MPTRSSFSLLLLLGCSIILWNCSGSQKTAKTPEFEGKVVYKMEYLDLPSQYQQYASMFPDEQTLYVRNHLSRQESGLGMGNQQSVIVNTETDSTTLLINIPAMGKKIRVHTARTGDSLNIDNPEIEDLDSTTTLAGYPCRYVRFNLSGRKDSTKLCVTQKIPAGAFNEFKGVDGFPLQFESRRGNFTVRLTAKKIKEMAVSDEKFNTTPKGYEKVTMDELKQMLQGLQGQ